MVSKYLAYNENVSVIYADTTELIKYIRKLQNLTYLTTNIMGKFYTISSIMGFSDIKEQSDEIIIQLSGETTGILYSSVKLKDKNVILKGFIENSKIDLKDYNGEIDISKIIGKSGKLGIVKNNKYTKLGYKGITPLISGNIVDDFKSYYEKSTQKPAFIGLEVIQDKELQKSSGYLITFMPDATEDVIKKIEENIKLFDFKSLIKTSKSFDEIIKIITGDNNIRKIEENLKIIYSCDCSKEKYRDMLFTLKKNDLEELLKEDKINVVCEYCNKSYDFSKTELEEIIKSLK